MEQNKNSIYSIDFSNELEFTNELLNKINNNILKIRLTNLVNWYIKHAKINKWMYYSLTIFSLLCSAGIIIVNATKGYSIQSLIISILTVLSGIAVGILNMIRSHENWTRYRISAESLKSEICKYIAEIEPYKNQTREEKFLQKIEEISILENKQFSKTSKINN